MKTLPNICSIAALLLVAWTPIAAQVSWNRTITFAGREWQVKTGTGGPGPNSWSDSPSSVWVDSAGLHLRIRRDGSTWYCAEVRTLLPSSYGMHRFYTDGGIDSLDPNVVFAPFLYVNDNREIDIEFSRWGVPTNPNAQYVLQPHPYVQGDNIDRFHFSLNGTLSTHYINWTPSEVTFKSIHGHHAEPPDPEHLIRQFTYSSSRNLTQAEYPWIHINLWLFRGQPPADSQEVEVLIANAYLPPPPTLTITATTGPNGSISPSGSIPMSYGSRQSFAITPDANHRIADVLVDGVSVGAVSSYTFSKVTSNHTIAASFSPALSVSEPRGSQHSAPKLHQNHPNPFSTITTIEFSLPRESHAELVIYNKFGIQVEILKQRHLPAGNHRVQWMPREIPSGVYFYQLRTAGYSITNKLMLTR